MLLNTESLAPILVLDDVADHRIADAELSTQGALGDAAGGIEASDFPHLPPIQLAPVGALTSGACPVQDHVGIILGASPPVEMAVVHAMARAAEVRSMAGHMLWGGRLRSLPQREVVDLPRASPVRHPELPISMPIKRVWPQDVFLGFKLSELMECGPNRRGHSDDITRG